MGNRLKALTVVIQKLFKRNNYLLPTILYHMSTIKDNNKKSSRLYLFLYEISDGFCVFSETLTDCVGDLP